MHKSILMIEEEIINLGRSLHVLNSMEDSVRIVSMDGVIIFANRKLIEEIGYDPVGSIAECYIHEDGKLSEDCLVRQCMEEGLTKQKEEIINGKCFSIKVSPIYNLDREITSCIEVFRDISKERTLELELFNKREKLEEDIEFARNIQRKILPTRKKYGNLSINYLYEPSEMLSGDVFDVFKIGRNQIGIYVADVSGHGLAAAMLAMYVKQAMRSIKEYHRSPAHTLKELHQRMHSLDLALERYLTLFYGVYDMDKETFKYSNAGHNSPPIMISGNDITLLELSGYPLFNLFKNVNYKEETVSFGKNDKILLYTDGITEKRLEDGSFLGAEGLISLIKDDPDNILVNIERFFDDGKPELDDYAAVLIERR